MSPAFPVSRHVRFGRTVVLAATLLCALWTAGCKQSPPAAEQAKESQAAAPAPSKPMPDIFKVKFETTQGDFVIECKKELAPLGVERFYSLVTSGFFDGAKFFRVLPGFVVQFGLAADPKSSQLTGSNAIADDPVKGTNTKGTITFATAGPNTRTTQVFINLGDNKRLDSMGFAPFGSVTEGMDVVEKLYSGYGEGAPYGGGPDQGSIRSQGNAYLEQKFPKLDGIKKASVLE